MTAVPPRSIDDFAEFFLASYCPVLDALRDAGMTATIEAGAVGHYLLVARDAQTSLGAAVEVTADGKPLPASPDDIGHWHLSTPTTTTRVPAGEGPRRLADAIRDLRQR